MVDVRRGSSVVEQWTENPCVGSSILPRGTTCIFCVEHVFKIGANLYRGGFPVFDWRVQNEKF